MGWRELIEDRIKAIESGGASAQVVVQPEKKRIYFDEYEPRELIEMPLEQYENLRPR